MLDLIIENELFSKLSEKYNYPLMKIVDMAFFNMGIEKEFASYYEKYIQTLTKPTSDIIWKKLVKCLKQFYYQMNNKEDFEIHVAFNCDKNQIDKFIAKYKIRVNE